VDIAAAIDEVVEEWRAKYPDLKSTQLDKILATAEKAKTVFLATPAKARSIDLDTITLPSDAVPFVAPHRRQVSNSTMSMNSTLAEARRIVRLAQLESSARNRERFANPRVNTYWAHLDSQSALRARAEDMATFVINETVAIAAAIVAEADSAHEEPVELPPIPADILQLRQQMFGEEAGGGLAKRADGFWMENVPHIGRVPFGGAANNGYKVFRNVKDYGAKGDGKIDDTAAIDRAMKDQGRCGENCGASTIKPAIVYFPSGTYLVSTPIISYYNTQMVGDVRCFPPQPAS
jgi:pectate lyase-like protein